MATTIKLKNGSGAPLAGDLVQGEPALDLTNKRLYTENASGTVIEVGTNPTSLTTGTFTSTGIDDNATSTAITIDASENVGIGTASPQFQLHLSGSAPGVVMSETGAVKYYRNRAAASALTWDILNTDYSFNSEVMRIDSSGNVGIGETAPSRALDIKSANPLNINTTSNNQIHFQVNDVTTGQYSSSSSLPHQLCDSTGSLSRLVVDASGNVGIGTTSPAYRLSVHADAVGTTYPLKIENSNTTSGNGVALLFTHRAHGGDNQGSIEYVGAGANNTNSMLFKTEASGVNGMAERMRIDSSGNLLVGTTTSRGRITSEASSGFCFDGYITTSTAGQDIFVIRSDVGGTANANLIIEANGDVQNTNNSYGSISDERLKSNIVDASSQIDDIMAVQVRSYTLNKTGNTHIGVVAQELEASGMSGLVKTDDEGMKSVKYSVLYMKAIKALQEAVTRIETLEAEVAALKGA